MTIVTAKNAAATGLNRNRPHAWLVLGYCVFGLSPAHAADTTEALKDSWLEPVLVSGSRIPEPRSTLSSAASVIDAATIEVRDPASLIDLLRTLPGVQVTQPGGGAGIASMYTRGCQANYTLFLVDGVKVTDSNDSRGGSFDLSTVAPGEIERIELIRGPQSAVYGADALCGAVNFITKSRSETWGTTLAGEGGRARLYGSSVELSGPVLERGGLSVSAGTGDQGDSVRGSTFGTSHANAKLTLDRGTDWRLVLHGRHAEDHGTVYPDLSGGPEFAASSARDVRKSKETSFDIQGRWAPGEVFGVNALASSYDHKVHFASPGIGFAIPPRGEDSDLKRQYGALNAAVALPASLKMSVGADYLHEDTNLNGYLFFGIALPDSYKKTRNVVGTFGEIEYAGIEGLTLLGSIRRDDPRTSHAETTSSAGAIYKLSNGTTTLRANWGQGYKLPSLWALGNALVGNPALLPETSRTTEVGITQWLLDRRLKVDLALFDNLFKNLIDFDNTSFSFVNRREVTGRGGEIEAAYELSNVWRVRGEATYVQIDPKDSGIPLRQRSKWRGSLELVARPMPEWTLSATFLAVGQTFDTTVINPPELYLGGYLRLDFNAEWQPNTRLRVNLAVDNVGNHRIEEAYGFLAAGITPRAGFRYRF